MKLRKTIKFISLLGLGTIISLPILTLTSCSSEASIKKFQYKINVSGKSIEDLKSKYIKDKIAYISSVPVLLMNLNLCTSNKSLLVSTPEIFAYLMGNSWISGGSTYVDESNRINFGVTKITVTSTGFDTEPTASATTTLDISKINITYGFYNPSNGTQLYTDINQIKSMLSKNSNINNDMLSKINVTEFNAEFNVTYNEELEVIKDAKDFSQKKNTDPKLTIGNSGDIKGSSEVSKYISNLSKTASTNNPNNIDQNEIKNKYNGSIVSIS